MSKYVAPKNMKNDMGGEGRQISSRLKEVFRLLEDVPLKAGKILDVGVGRGQISEYCLDQWNPEEIYGTGFEIESYGIDERIIHKGLKLKECSAENMPFADGYFDIVIASHILEHVPNMGKALSEIRRVLKAGGYLYLFVPHFSEYVLAGHINTGWNIGQLMYVLLLNEFNVSEGRFVEFGYSVCACVRKADNRLPVLRGDRGDIHLLNEKRLFSRQVTEKQDGMNDNFYGGIKAVNWKNVNELLKIESEKWSGSGKFLRGAIRVMAKIIGEQRVRKIGELMIEPRIVNPKVFD